MWSSLKIASQGVLAQQHSIDIASSNLANVDRIAYKKQREDLADIKPTNSAYGVGTQPGPLTLDQRADGGGAVMMGILSSFEQGADLLTEHPLDFAIKGPGFVRVTTKDGQVGYTRNGSLRVDADGQLVTGAGAVVTPPILIPKDARDVHITEDGNVMGQIGTQDPRSFGQITLSRFTNVEGLTRSGQDLYLESAASGAPTDGLPGTKGLGALLPGSLENSNVDSGDEVVRMMQAQRAYQVNLRSLKTVDEMLQAANNLRR